jgi:hypothetical protein
MENSDASRRENAKARQRVRRVGKANAPRNHLSTSSRTSELWQRAALQGASADPGTHHHRTMVLSTLGPPLFATMQAGGHGSRLKAGTTSAGQFSRNRA